MSSTDSDGYQSADDDIFCKDTEFQTLNEVDEIVGLPSKETTEGSVLRCGVETSVSVSANKSPDELNHKSILSENEVQAVTDTRLGTVDEVKENAGSQNSEIGNLVGERPVSTSEDPKKIWNDTSWYNFLSSASSSLTSLTTNVSSGISTVIESGFGMPNITDTVKDVNVTKTEEPLKTETNEKQEVEETAAFAIGNLFGGVTELGNKVICEGLNTLETLGKKTMEVLQEGDPGFKKKRSLLFNSDKTELAQVLREAIEQAKRFNKDSNIKDETSFESYFDNHKGTLHLAGLEAISNQCKLKIQTKLLTCSSGEMIDSQQTMTDVQEIFNTFKGDEDTEPVSDSVLIERLEHSLSRLMVNVPIVDLIEKNKELAAEISKIENKTVDKECQQLYDEAVLTLAQITAFSIKIYHKIAEQLLLKPHHYTACECDCLIEVTKALCGRIVSVANSYCGLLVKGGVASDHQYLTDIFVETANGTSYIQQAYEKMIPVLQVGALAL